MVETYWNCILFPFIRGRLLLFTTHLAWTNHQRNMLHWKSTRYNYHPSSSLCAMWFSLYKIGSLIRTSSGIKQPQYLWQKKTWCGIFLETSYSKYIWSNLWLILLKNWWSWAYMNTIDLRNKFSHNSNNEVLFLCFFPSSFEIFGWVSDVFWEICYVCYQKKKKEL